jgi:glycerophosphoryl diester phosphodiesterase
MNHMHNARIPVFLGLTLALLAAGSAAAAGKVVIAHRGASGYLPEHTLEAYALAYAQGADYIEPDLSLTRDGVPIALHDKTLNATTDAAARFPARARDDGGMYPIDFTLAEIKQLRVRERVNAETGEQVYPNRWNNHGSTLHFRIPTLAEVIELVQGLNRTTGRNVGIYPETKHSTWIAEQGQNLEQIVLDVLHQYGYRSAADHVVIQSFEPESLQRLRALGSELTHVQLMGTGRADAWMTTAAGLDQIATFANGIGPSINLIFDRQGKPVNDNFLVREAHARGLIVHPYTVRRDNLPPYANSVDELLEKVLFEAGADGLFCDFPDLAVQFLKKRAKRD